jgi:hypothetical protein
MARARVLLRAMLSYVFCPLLLCPGSWGEDQKPSEYQVEAAYLYNFGKFVDWPNRPPDNAPTSFVICVLGDDPFGTSLDRVLERGMVRGKGLAARRIARIHEAGGCQVLYISSSEASHIGKIISMLGNTSVLTVSDIPQFTDLGGMIQFVVADGRVRFQINQTAADNAGLVLRSELLRVAVTVKRSTPPG